MAGRKTHEQQLRILERKDDVAKSREAEDRQAVKRQVEDEPFHPPRHPEARRSELPVSQHGMNQESIHNKHNDPPKPKNPGRRKS